MNRFITYIKLISEKNVDARKTLLSAMSLLSLIIPISVMSQEGFKISHGDTIYNLSNHVILLDKEGIYGCDEAFTNPSDAFRMVNYIKDTATILVAPSVYWLDDPDDPTVRIDAGGTPFAVRLACDTLRIIGLSDDPRDIVFAVDRGQTQGATGNFTMFEFSGSSLETQNVTFGNYCNADLEYPRNPALNRKKRKNAIVQAQIGICRHTDRLFADNCRFISRLNLCPFIGARRSLYRNCYFECTDDALSGSAVYLDCRFTFFSSKPFYSTAETGAVFLNCDITCLGSGKQYFTKVPGLVTVINTRFHSEHPIEIAWTRDASDIICRQSGISLNGRSIIIDASRPELGPGLEESALMDAYRFDFNGKEYYNLPNLLNGNDGWDPTGLNGVVALAEETTGKKFTGLPVAIRMETDKDELKAQKDTAIFKSTTLLWGGYPVGNVTETVMGSDNTKPIAQNVTLRHSTPSGLSAQKSIKILPFLKDAPKFRKKPVIRYNRRLKQFEVRYSLKGKGKDTSKILWGRVEADADGNKHVNLIRQGKGKDYRQYVAKAPDLGCGLVAMVIPEYSDSKTGEARVATPVKVLEERQVTEFPESRVNTDFKDVPVVRRSPGTPGIWCFDIYKPLDTHSVEWPVAKGPGWEYGKGYDASTGTGLIQNQKGARLSYVPVRESCKDMTAKLTVEPAKSGGQGFGSATSQYMDICVKFNPVSLDGYALRIERTPDHDRAVRFYLIKYRNGLTSVIDEGTISNCFRTPCTINVGITDGILSADASTEAPETKPCCDVTLPEVHLSAHVEDNGQTGFCIQHTGSTGPSSSMIKDVCIEWK